jgi:hypothetical protein
MSFLRWNHSQEGKSRNVSSLSLSPAHSFTSTPPGTNFRARKALTYSASRTSTQLQHLHSVFVSTYGVLFLGTPHDGSNKADLASTARKIIDAMVPSKVFDTDGQLLEALQEGSEVLQNVTAQFAPLMSNFRVYFFWEQEKTDLGVTRKYVSFDTCFPSICGMRGVAKSRA